ncbi:gluconokinase [Cognatilysobacter bugurensis]|uniref:Gluconokinase n=1 Tax=Cognatilysobacter bugurensis TaxID=543356 RepID=A0A918SUQ6_9GAMM|nr:gluconokinase [Lysobacter bugurensis]GHA72218.1 gluconokinase [Lysobacter bugurensis]
MSTPRIVLVTGVSGSGKTTVGTLLAHRLGWPYFEGDDFHPKPNRERMAQGLPLEESHRAPWLAALRTCMDQVRATGGRAVFSCSALRESHREQLVGESDDVLLVHLTGDYRTIHGRVVQRQGHFFDPALVASQFETLEPPRDALAIDVGATPEAIVELIVQAMG